MDFISFNRPCFAGNEQRYIADAFANGHIAGDGEFSRKCCELLERELGVPKALLTTSCTHALEAAALLLDIQPGDEVIVPSFAFVSTVNPFVLRGAKPVFVDIRRDTLNIDERILEEFVSDRAKAIVPLHYAGVGCEMDIITEIADRRGIRVVEDNAHGLFAKFRDKQLGAFGCLGAQSFHETKNFTCGEGGALLVNDVEMIRLAEILREKGTDRTLFLRGEVDKYTWINVGSSYLPSDILAAVLYAQLERWQDVEKARKGIWDYYYENLSSWADEHGVRLPTVPAYCHQSYHMFYMLMPGEKKRNALIAHLRKNGIESVFHFLPLHLSKMGQRFHDQKDELPVTVQSSACLIRLPFYNELTLKEQDRVIEAIFKFE